jgi:O-antigen/teichoic acid export membrane protein
LTPTDPDRIDPGIGGLRRHTARGTMINSAYQVGIALIGLIQRIAVAAFLTREEFGLWGIVLTILVTLSWLKELGIMDKYVQQSEGDQRLAWQKAFTLELYSSLVFVVVVAAVLPLYALAYDRTEIIVPALVLSLSVPLFALQAPSWVYYRRLDYGRQRLLTGVDPVVALVATLSFGVAGMGYWSLVLGVLAGRLAGGLVCVFASPYPFRLRFDSGTLRDYVSFSWPLVGAGVSALVIVQGSVLAVDHAAGLAAVGVVGLVAAITAFTDRVDTIVSDTLYPAVCAVVDRTELLFEAFVKSNRLALMWAMPFGAGLALFAGDFVGPVFGDEWKPAAGLLGAIGLTSAFAQLAFNWQVFLRALNWTQPIFVSAVANVVTFLVVGIPAIIALGLTGFAIAVAAMTLVQIVLRWHYMSRVFGGFKIFRHLGRAIAPTVPPAALVLLIRVAAGDSRTGSLAVVEAIVYAVGVIACTALFERKLLLEAFGYLRGERQRPAVAAA